MNGVDSNEYDDQDLSELFRDYKQAKQDKRSQNREQSAAILKERGAIFTSHNGGAHLIVEGKTGYIDYWPGTGRWNNRQGLKGFGLRSLLEQI